MSLLDRWGSDEIRVLEDAPGGLDEPIKEYFKQHKLGSITNIKPAGQWAKGDLYHVTVKRLRPPTEFTVYELDGEIKTVRSLQTGKTY